MARTSTEILAALAECEEHADDDLCCCGDSYSKHGDPYDTGHTPVNQYDYTKAGLLAELKATNPIAWYRYTTRPSPAPAQQGERVGFDWEGPSPFIPREWLNREHVEHRFGLDLAAPGAERTVVSTHGVRNSGLSLDDLILQPEAIHSIDPTPTPFMQMGRRMGKTMLMRELVGKWLETHPGAVVMAQGGRVVAVIHDEIQVEDGKTDEANEAMKRRDEAGYRPARELPQRLKDLGYTEEGLDRDNPYTQHITPPGLLMLSPMDGRLGNRWAP